MPWWSTLEVAAWKISLFASTTAASTSSSEPAWIEAPLEQLHGEGAGDLARLVSAHAVGDDEHRLLDEDAVLVLLADAARIGDDPPTQLGTHCASKTV